MQILHEDIKNYESAKPDGNLVFYERGVIDALGMAQESAAMPVLDLTNLIAKFVYHPVAFVLPPWESIYVQDNERDQSFAESVFIYSQVLRWYAKCGYAVHEVPKTAVHERADYVLQVATEGAA